MVPGAQIVSRGELGARRGIVVVLVLAAAGALAYGLVRATGARSARVAGGPVVDTRAFRSHGRLAFVSRGVLWVLDGTHGTLRRLPKPPGFVAAQPAYSADGRWLAYLAQRTDPVNGTLTARLWIARADGTAARVVAGITPYALYGWSPRADMLAVAAGPEQTQRPCPCYSPTTLRLVTPDGRSRVLSRGPWIYGAAWAPDGHALAVAIEGPLERSRLATFPVGGGRPTVWLQFTRHEPLNGMTQILLEVAGWWRGVGIGVWVFGEGMVHNNDETPLDVVAAPRAQPRLLAETLSDGTTTAFASSAGRVAVVADVSHGVDGGRVIWSKKQVQVCNPRGRCRGLVARASKVTVDPAWSPDGSTLAFVEAPAFAAAGWPQRRLHLWYARHRLLLYDTTTGRLAAVPQAGGATVPLWGRDGKSLLYVAGDALWLLRSASARPVEVASPLFPRENWPAYYGQVAWSAQFAWSAARHGP